MKYAHFPIGLTMPNQNPLKWVDSAYNEQPYSKLQGIIKLKYMRQAV